MTLSSHKEDFLKDYNLLLSKAGQEDRLNFSSIASPTLNKQETVTFLYLKVNKFLTEKEKTPKKSKPALSDYAKFARRLLYVLLNLSRISLNYRVKKLPTNATFLRTWLVPKSIQQNRITDDYFREMVDELNSQKLIVGFMPNGFSSLGKLKKISLPENYILTPGLLSIRDIVMLFIDYLVNGHYQLKKRYHFKGEDISILINESLTDDYLLLRSFPAFLEKYISLKVRKYEPKKIVYIYENQAWERALIQSFSKTRTKLIGYQSSGFSLRFLNFFPTGIDKMENFFPSKILTVGQVYTSKLKEFGDYGIPIETFAALRFNYECDEANRYIIKQQSSVVKKRIIYAFPVLIYQYEKIIEDLVEAFGHSEIEVDLKFHPLFLEDNMNNFMDLLPQNFSVVEHVDMTSLSETYDIVIFNDNSFGIESLIQGVPSFEYDLSEGIDDTRLFDFNLYECKLDKDGLVNIKKKIISENLPQLDQNEVSEYIHKVYTPFESQRANLNEFLS